VTKTRAWSYPYKPTARQKQAHKSGADETLFGGAAGGGKSEFLLGSLVTLCLLVPGVQVVAFRRTFPDLKRSLILKLMPRLPKQIAKYNSQDHAWNFANGSRLEMAYLKNENDIYNYQGAEYALVAFDELTQFTEAQYKYLLSRARAGGDVLKRMQQLGLTPAVIATANPGGIGHNWVKTRFIDPAPPMTLFQSPATEDEPDPLTRRFIPSLMTDNPHLDQDQYRRMLQAMDPVLRQALLEGNWDILDGVRFSQWRAGIHVIKPEDLPLNMLGDVRCVGVDYGFSAPFAAVWMAKLADGLIVVYREAYATELTATQQAQLILDSEAPGERDAGHHIPVVMDPAMWRRNDSAAHKTLDKDAPPVGSPAHDYQKVLGQRPIRGMNSRVSGWSTVDEKLRVRGDGLPRLLVYDTCRDFIRTLPSLPRARTNPEDIDTHAEDHIADAFRYGLLQLEGKRGTGDYQEQVPASAVSTLTAGLSPANF